MLDSDLKDECTYARLVHVLKVLAAYAATSTSRIVRVEVLEGFIPQLILVKRMLLELSVPYF